MNITLNGTPHTTDHTTLIALIQDTIGTELTNEGTAADGTKLGIAAALDRAVVPRSQWATTPITDGQTIDIITAVQGG